MEDRKHFNNCHMASMEELEMNPEVDSDGARSDSIYVPTKRFKVRAVYLYASCGNA